MLVDVEVLEDEDEVELDVLELLLVLDEVLVLLEDELVEELVLLEVEVQVKSLLPITNSLIFSTIFGYNDSCTSTLRLSVKYKVILYRENSYFSASDSRPIL